MNSSGSTIIIIVLFIWIKLGLWEERDIPDLRKGNLIANTIDNNENSGKIDSFGDFVLSFSIGTLTRYIWRMYNE